MFSTVQAEPQIMVTGFNLHAIGTFAYSIDYLGFQFLSRVAVTKQPSLFNQSLYVCPNKSLDIGRVPVGNDVKVRILSKGANNALVIATRHKKLD